jgi:hypothetical protein
MNICAKCRAQLTVWLIQQKSRIEDELVQLAEQHSKESK